MRAAHARLDAYAHNPYPLDPKRETPVPRRLHELHHDHDGDDQQARRRSSARNFPRARIWLTEYGYQTNPPDRLLGVSPALQARYVGEGSYVAYRTARVDMLIHFLVRDEPNLARFQSGVLTLAGKAKPAYAAYQLPLAETARTGSRTALWGQLRAPGAGGSVRIERRSGGAWRTVATRQPGCRTASSAGPGRCRAARRCACTPAASPAPALTIV